MSLPWWAWALIGGVVASTLLLVVATCRAASTGDRDLERVLDEQLDADIRRLLDDDTRRLFDEDHPA